MEAKIFEMVSMKKNVFLSFSLHNGKYHKTSKNDLVCENTGGWVPECGCNRVLKYSIIMVRKKCSISLCVTLIVVRGNLKKKEAKTFSMVSMEKMFSLFSSLLNGDTMGQLEMILYLNTEGWVLNYSVGRLRSRRRSP